MYRGTCPTSGETLTLPRTEAAEHEALRWVAELPPGEGKMYGVLLTDGPEVLRAVSGLTSLEGCVPSIGLGLQPSQLELTTLARLAELKEELGLLPDLPSRETAWKETLASLNRDHVVARSRREEMRQRGTAESGVLERESQIQTRQRRDLRRAARQELEPLRARILDLKHERRRLSRTLQAEMHARLDNVLFQGEPWSLASLFPSGAPTGVGECCAPKLLYAASLRGLRPVAMAELWWGEPRGDRHPGTFYQACAERCQPLLGPLLAGARRPLQVLYEDEEIVVVNKPPGVLSVPGRGTAKQDCVLTRLAYADLLPVHRLDLETSGVLLFARNVARQALLQGQFAQRSVTKRYEALLVACPSEARGTVELPVPCGRVEKAALTHFAVLDRANARVELEPVTGRTHQLRRHMAFGLGCPIRGDRLYGQPGGRLLLHARELTLEHRGKALCLRADVPF